MTVQADDPISFMQLTAKTEMSSKEDQFELSLLAAMGNTQRKEAADPLASKLNKVRHKLCTAPWCGTRALCLKVNSFDKKRKLSLKKNNSILPQSVVFLLQLDGWHIFLLKNTKKLPIVIYSGYLRGCKIY